MSCYTYFDYIGNEDKYKKRSRVIASMYQDMMVKAIENEDQDAIIFVYDMFRHYESLDDKYNKVKYCVQEISLNTTTLFFECAKLNMIKVAKNIMSDSSTNFLEEYNFRTLKKEEKAQILKVILEIQDVPIDKIHPIQELINSSSKFEHLQPKINNIFINHFKTGNGTPTITLFKQLYDLTKDQFTDDDVISYIRAGSTNLHTLQYLLKDRPNIAENKDVQNSLVEQTITNGKLAELVEVVEKYGLDPNKYAHYVELTKKQEHNIFVYIIGVTRCNFETFEKLLTKFYPELRFDRLEEIAKVLEVDQTGSCNSFLLHVINNQYYNRIPTALQKAVIDISLLEHDAVESCLNVLIKPPTNNSGYSYYTYRYDYNNEKLHKEFVFLFCQKYTKLVVSLIQKTDTRTILDYVLTNKIECVINELETKDLKPQDCSSILSYYITHKMIEKFFALFTSLDDSIKLSIVQDLFKHACRHKSISVASFLSTSYSIDYHSDYDTIFNVACSQNEIQIALLLAKLFPHFELTIKEAIASHSIDKVKFITVLLSLVEIKKYEEFMSKVRIEWLMKEYTDKEVECYICKKNHKKRLLLKLECDHYFCAQSLLEYYKATPINYCKCMYCKKEFQWRNCIGYYKIE